MNQRPLETISEEITPIDHQILSKGGTSSNLERLPSRLANSKRRSPDINKQLEELVYEMSYLRAELQWHKENKQIFLHFREQMLGIFQEMEGSIEQASLRIYESEQRFLSLWDANDGGVKI